MCSGDWCCCYCYYSMVSECCVAPPSDDHSYAHSLSTQHQAAPEPQHPSLFRHSAASCSDTHTPSCMHALDVVIFTPAFYHTSIFIVKCETVDWHKRLMLWEALTTVFMSRALICILFWRSWFAYYFSVHITFIVLCS